MLNFQKVENYTREKLKKDYAPYYPKEIFEGLKVEAFSGSFGACLLSISYENDNPHKLNELDAVYVSNYSKLDGIISHFVIRNYDLIASRVYEKHQKEKGKGMRCVLEIFNNREKVNEFIYTEPEEIKSQLVKIIIAEKRRGVRTTYKPKPYSQDMDIIEKWTREEAHTSANIKYVYHFYNLDY